MTYLLSFLLTLTVLVFVHELGHYLVAKYNGVRVKSFSIGFGPVLYKKEMFDTEWRISAIPLGGYIQMHGEYFPVGGNKSEGELTAPTTSASQPEPSPADAEDTLNNKSLWQRTAIVIAGPLANILLALLLFWFMFAARGVTTPGNLLIDGFGQIVADSPADLAGLQVGDIPLAINDTAVQSFEQFSELIQQTEGAEFELDILRNSQQLTTQVIATPDQANPERLLLGIALATKITEVSVLEALQQATTHTFEISWLIVKAVGALVTGQGLQQVGGPVAIAQIAQQSILLGFFSFINFLALFSINLAILNLLPIPALDGGYLLVYLATGLFGEKFGRNLLRYGLPIGIAFLVTLMILLFSVDIIRLISG